MAGVIVTVTAVGQDRWRAGMFFQKGVARTFAMDDLGENAFSAIAADPVLSAVLSDAVPDEPRAAAGAEGDDATRADAAEPDGDASDADHGDSGTDLTPDGNAPGDGKPPKASSARRRRKAD